MFIKKLIFILLSIPSIAFANSGAWWMEASADCKPDQPGKTYNVKYSEEGHLNTTYVVARIAGYTSLDAAQLACYSQMPDAAVMRLSAPAVGLWGIFSPDYRNMIVANLHSLHNGKNKEVEQRRNQLTYLLNNGIKTNMPVWQLGFIVHAMGDSYGHVHGRDDSLEAYGQGVGHVFAFSEKPDVIAAHDENFNRYQSYVTALYETIKTDSPNPETLAKFLSEVAAAAKSRNEEEVISAIKNFNFYKSKEEFDSLKSSIKYSLNKSQNEFSSHDEKVFLWWLRSQLAQPKT